MIVISEDPRPQGERIAAARKVIQEADVAFDGILDGAFVSSRPAGYAFDVNDFEQGEFFLAGYLTAIGMYGEFGYIECLNGSRYLVSSHESHAAVDSFWATQVWVDENPQAIVELKHLHAEHEAA